MFHCVIELLSAPHYESFTAHTHTNVYTLTHTHTHTHTHTPHAVDAYQQVAEAFAEVLSPGTPTPTPTPAPAGVPEPAGGVWLYEKGNASDVFLRYR